MQKDTTKKEEIIGSETILEKIKTKTPWIFGKKLRKPKINFPKLRRMRISLPMPSRSLSVIIILIVLFVLQTGVVYLIVRDPPALGADANQNPIFIYLDINESFIIEGIVASVLIIFCSTGFVLLYQASKYVYNKKMAVSILTIGALMIIITFLLLQYMIAVKMRTI
ncbi:MAG: hypothetical protein JSV62_03595 [Promethearchaeota archaeon]|nr:MAG: hypothetical protein JSV62_03595 [Candidatus Lokiarchaeota archaeon]